MVNVVPLLSIVIVNWNGKRFLDDCLGSLQAQSFDEFEVVFVDNGSTDDSLEFVKGNFPKVIIVESKVNLGFAGGNNLGIEAAKGDFILTLNNDTDLEADFLESLVEAVDASDKDVGMWAPKILSMEDRKTIDSVGGLLFYPDGLARGRGRGEQDRGQYDDIDETFIPSACAALYRREMLDEIGLFDEEFFAYCEDTDLGLRARLAGWRTRSVAKAKVYHIYSGTSGRYSPFKAYLVERNRLWVAIKNLPLGMLLVSPIYTLWRYIIQSYGVISRKGAGGRFLEGEGSSAFGLVSILVKSYLGVLRKLPEMLSKRVKVQQARKVSTATFRGWLKRDAVTAVELVLKD